jgi:hypothetical protein
VVGFHTDAVTFFFREKKRKCLLLRWKDQPAIWHTEGGREGGEGGGSEPAGGVGIGVFDYGV